LYLLGITYTCAHANIYKVEKVQLLCMLSWSWNCWDSEEIRHSQSLQRGHEIIWRGE